MGPSEALCLLTQNNLQQLTNVSIKLFCQSVSIGKCVYSVFCDISLWIKWAKRDFVHPHPINLLPFDVKHVQFVVFCRKASLCNAHALSLFSQHTFSCLSTFWCFASLPGLSTFLAEGKHTQQLVFRSSRLSSYPKPFCLPRCEVDDLWENRVCHTNVCCLPYPRKHRQFESPAKDCPHWCRWVPTFRRTAFWACCNKIIHQDFSIFEDCHPHLNRLVQLHPISADADTCKVVCELRAPRKQRACNQFAIFPLSSPRIIFLSLRFYIFSIVLPKTALFMSL